MDLLIGMVTALIILFSFFVFKKNTFAKAKYIHCFFVIYVLFNAFALKPSEYFIFWIGFAFLLFCVFDDWLTKELYVFIPILITLFFLIILGNPYLLLNIFFIFTPVIIVIKLTKEQYVGEGDAYFLLPFIVLLPILKFFAFIFIAISLISIFYYSIALKKEVKEIPFTPFLFISGIICYANFYVDYVFLGSFVGVLFFSLLYFIVTFFQKKKR